MTPTEQMIALCEEYGTPDEPVRALAEDTLAALRDGASWDSDNDADCDRILALQARWDDTPEAQWKVPGQSHILPHAQALHLMRALSHYETREVQARNAITSALSAVVAHKHPRKQGLEAHEAYRRELLARLGITKA